jgi:hypothetical protein
MPPSFPKEKIEYKQYYCNFPRMHFLSYYLLFVIVCSILYTLGLTYIYICLFDLLYLFLYLSLSLYTY